MLLDIRDIRSPRRETAGSVLIVAVWMLALLFLMTMGLTRKANQELVYVKHSIQRMQARYAAWAGFHYAVEMIREDTQDDNSKMSDNLFACGVKIPDGKTAEDLFKGIALSQGSFDITAKRVEDGKTRDYYGLGDEDGKFNLNALSLQNYGVFKQLLIIEGVPEKQALQIAGDALDWRDEDQAAFSAKNTEQKEEGPYYFHEQKLPVKNRPFDLSGELMFISGMTPEIFQKIKDLVTVYPRRSERLQVNLSTAPREILLALAYSFAGPATNSSTDDAQSLVDKILNSRAGSDRVDGTSDDRPVAEKEMTLNMAETSIFRSMMQMQTKTSRFLTAHITGWDATGQRKSQIDAVIDRETLTVSSWRMD